MPARKELTKKELAQLALDYATWPMETAGDLGAMHALRMRVIEEAKYILELPFL